jgi:hypothetical protein
MTDLLDWDARAAAVIRTADIKKIDYFLTGPEPPKTAPNFYHLLKNTASNQRKGSQSDLDKWGAVWEVILNSLIQEAKLSSKRKSSLPSAPKKFSSISNVFTTTQDTGTLVDDIFEQSLKDARKGDKDGDDVALRIWDRPECQNSLLRHEALWLCAQYGHVLILNKILERLAAAHSENHGMLMQTICQTNHTKFTALGLAIIYGQSKCVTALADFMHYRDNGDTGQSLFNYEHSCGIDNTPILHFLVNAADINSSQFASHETDSDERKEHVR